MVSMLKSKKKVSILFHVLSWAYLPVYVYEVAQGCLCQCAPPVLPWYLIGVFRPKQCLGPPRNSIDLRDV